MAISIDIARHTRRNFIRLLEGFTIAELNLIPPGFSNNIAWNFAHIVSAQQRMCYIMAGVEPVIPLERITKYQKDTKPEGFMDQEELDYYKEQALRLIDVLESDLSKRIFDNYNAFTTVFGVTLQHIDDAVAYFTTHDNLHLGYAMALRKAVNQLSSHLQIQSDTN